VGESCYLGVEISDSNRAVLAVDDKTILTKREIMRDAVGTGATMKLAARKLDSLGRIKAHSSMTNDESNLAKLKSQCMLAQSIAEIKAGDKAATEEKKSKELRDLVMLAGPANSKLAAKNGDLMKITKREICAILLVYYGTSVEEGKYAKQALVDMLSAKIEAGPENIVIPAAAAAAAAAPSSRAET
jgi:hypothetical protein